MSYTLPFSLVLGPANKNLTLLAAIVNPDLSLQTKDISIAGEVPPGSGCYFASVTIADGQQGFVAFYTGSVGAGTDLSGVTVLQEAALDQGVGVTLATSENLYHATFDCCHDDANSTDEWTVTWFKNGVRIASGITSPTLQLVKRADGTDLLAATSMTQIGTTGSYKLDATGSNRLTAGQAVLAITSATIDGATRTFSTLTSRDST